MFGSVPFLGLRLPFSRFSTCEPSTSVCTFIEQKYNKHTKLEQNIAINILFETQTPSLVSESLKQGFRRRHPEAKIRGQGTYSKIQSPRGRE
jgi:hypothetical protein